MKPSRYALFLLCYDIFGLSIKQEKALKIEGIKGIKYASGVLLIKTQHDD